MAETKPVVEAKPTDMKEDEKVVEKTAVMAKIKEYKRAIEAKCRRRGKLNALSCRQRDEYDLLTMDIEHLQRNIRQQQENWYKKYEETIGEPEETAKAPRIVSLLWLCLVLGFLVLMLCAGIRSSLTELDHGNTVIRGNLREIRSDLHEMVIRAGTNRAYLDDLRGEFTQLRNELKKAFK